jgi:3-phenylpropionate/cinnamic acid dioxygenase small subunit
MVSAQDHQAVVEFLYREGRLADEARYAEWLALWTDDAVYWVPATTDPAADPETRLSHIYDNRARLETRIKLLQTGHRYSQEPASLMRRLISNIEVAAGRDGELVAGSNFILAELSIQAKSEMHWWVGRATHHLRRVDGLLRMRLKKVVLINAAEPLPNLSFLI